MVEAYKLDDQRNLPYYKNDYYWFSLHFLVSSIVVLLVVSTFILPLFGIQVITDDRRVIINDLLPERKTILYAQSFFLMGMLFTYIGLLFYNEDVLRAPLNDLRTIIDTKGKIAIIDDKKEFLSEYASKESSGIIDLPIMDVCEVLYRYREEDGEKEN
ncbi:phosphatidylinositol N-acetylglucosaminyltransferase GPI19 NDAI_0H01710 [Naumovozyma dairenensis CBS 421]|uniref:PIG-P domain-containing protein n=1 Tax=Naumovozyma dairenensis (strain ATCC 10597 / BCRC 20456 / CBS 421 / NBRC 0211 / NRRL Y-12639) TaxID=1071378 RepID=G0WEY4_NAUDC|nr:hypothetical protein NDAI_0H01710 [Naumovozyma dairenensis CBS 421]CCD26345.1 hypothetical protein NDAI_0H01710 [Naumovozyma dairenensis CBS 421]